MEPTLWLRIDKQESLLEPGLIEISWEPIFMQQADMLAIKEFRKKCDKNAYEFTKCSFEEVMKATNEDGTAPIEIVGIKNAGKSLYSNFVDGNFFKEYRDKCHEIYISTRMIYVPWELVISPEKEDDMPWGIKYAIGNQVRSPLDVKEKQVIPFNKDTLDVLLIGANTRADLPYVEQEIDQVKECLLRHDRIKCEILLVNPPAESNDSRVSYFPLTYFNVLSKLREEKFDIIHYAGHIARPDTKDLGSALVLEMNKDTGTNNLLYSQIIYDNLGGKPFVFLNGCSMMWETAPLVITTIADGFILGGARGVVVPRTPIFDDDAMRIAVNYYDRVLNGETFGEALRQIRKEEYNKNSSNIIWLTYTLFGKPGGRLISLEREIFLYAPTVSAKILNTRIFEEDALCLLQQANFFALKSDSKEIEVKHLVAAFTHSQIFARIFADAAGDDLWRVLTELRIRLLGKEISTKDPSEWKSMSVIEELGSQSFMTLLKDAHAICEKASLPKIRTIDLCRALLISENDPFAEVVAEIAEKFKLNQITTVDEFARAFHEIVVVQGTPPVSLTHNLFSLDGRFNMDFISPAVRQILARSAYFHGFKGDNLLPEEVFKICCIIPGSNTCAFIEKNDPEFPDRVREFKDLLLQDAEIKIELTADMLADETERVFKRAAYVARWESTKLNEKHLIRSLAEYALATGDEDFPDNELLEKLRLDTISWIEN